MKKILLFVILLAGFTVGGWQNAAYAQPRATTAQSSDAEMYEFKEGQKAYNNGDYAKAMEWHTKAAGKGNGSSMYMVGVMYVNGYGVPQDWPKAGEWFLRAIEKGNSNAMYTLGTMYANNKHYTEAAKCYRMAADKGDADAMYKLGNLYFFGDGVPKDYAKTLEWFRKSADKGNAEAMHGVGLLYYRGQGVAENNAEALKWFQKAADKGVVDGIVYVGYMYGEGMGVARDYAKAADYYNRAAQRSSGDAAKNYADKAAEYRQKAIPARPVSSALAGTKWAHYYSDPEIYYSSEVGFAFFADGRVKIYDAESALLGGATSTGSGTYSFNGKTGEIEWDGKSFTISKNSDGTLTVKKLWGRDWKLKKVSSFKIIEE